MQKIVQRSQANQACKAFIWAILIMQQKYFKVYRSSLCTPCGPCFRRPLAHVHHIAANDCVRNGQKAGTIPSCTVQPQAIIIGGY